ncbi:MAG: DUF362 domain-containing protein [Spirochaetales bacterium]|jgi:uncharacterized protein (DUF362 family)/ferredoxin|nr:DUF362 domain-containing protein [Spirochaetales bacterium]
MSTVVLIGCPSYESQSVYAAVRKGIELLGGAAAFAKAGEKILLKPNMLSARAPELAVTTHPAVFEAAARIFQEAGAALSYGDSPGYEKPAHVARKTGIAGVAEKLNVSAADFETAVAVSGFLKPQDAGNLTFPIAKGVCEADGVISLSKMKTHSMTRLTGAVKNQLGCVVGFEKARLHFRNPNPREFSLRLAAITKIVNPRLYIMDGVIAMEGEGPSGGSPVHMGVLLFSRDPVALDAVFCRLVNLDPAHVPTIAAGQALGLGTANDISLAGDPLENFIKPDFDVLRKPVADDILFRPLRPFKNSIIPRPVIDAAKCKKCGVCVEACPVQPRKALAFPGSARAAAPVYTYSRCIRCYCCQEMCPHKAISVKTPLFGRFITRFLGKF